MKFGGASVATPESFLKIAKIIIERSLSDEKINELNCTDKWQHMHLFEPKTFKMIKTDKVRITCPHNDTGVTTRYEKYDENIHFHNKIN